VAFFGPSGCGKSTLLYVLSGIDSDYNNGTITVNNKDISKMSKHDLAIFRQTDIGIIFQQFNLIPSLTVLQNVALPMSFLGTTSAVADIEAMKLLQRLNISDYSSRYPSELSGGQQQRVGIARALANNPPIVIADEPLGNLDSMNAKNVLEFLKELNEKDGRTIIMVTHEAWSLQNVRKVFYMKDGAFTNVENKVPATGEGGPLTAEMAAAKAPAIHRTRTLEDPTTRALSLFLMRGHSLDEIQRLEGFVRARFVGDIDAASFEAAIDRPYKDGGVGLWKHKAKSVAQNVEDFISQRYDIEAIEHILTLNPGLPLDEESRRIESWLTREYHGHLSDEQRSAVQQLIVDLIY
jgi:putative ABC transport system ATP-binding protein